MPPSRVYLAMILAIAVAPMVGSIEIRANGGPSNKSIGLNKPKTLAKNPIKLLQHSPKVVGRGKTRMIAVEGVSEPPRWLMVILGEKDYKLGAGRVNGMAVRLSRFYCLTTSYLDTFLGRQEMRDLANNIWPPRTNFDPCKPYGADREREAYNYWKTTKARPSIVGTRIDVTQFVGPHYWSEPNPSYPVFNEDANIDPSTCYVYGWSKPWKGDICKIGLNFTMAKISKIEPSPQGANGKYKLHLSDQHSYVCQSMDIGAPVVCGGKVAFIVISVDEHDYTRCYTEFYADRIDSDFVFQLKKHKFFGGPR